MQMILNEKDTAHISVHYDKGKVPDIKVNKNFQENVQTIKIGDLEIWILEREE